MIIDIENLANIKNAKNIKINNFNLYIGKNGSGKTYFSKLIYFLLDAKFTLQIFDDFFREKISTSANAFDKEIIFSIDEINSYYAELCKKIKKKFPSYLGLDKDGFKALNCQLRSSRTSDFKLEFTDSFLKSMKKDEDPEDTYHSSVLYDFFRSETILQAHYLPAARANFMITYKYLIEAIITRNRKSPFDKDNESESVFPEVEMNFLMDIFKVDTKNYSQYSKYANKVENEVLKTGKLSIKNPKSQDLPSYKYKLNNQKNSIELIGVSSSVTELSPLIMYLRHGIKYENEMLIIDEPELSLHPEAQNALVGILVECVNDGLKIILVTHSPYIIEAVNNHLQRSKLENIDLSKSPKIKMFPKLDPEDTAAYLFESNTIKNIMDDQVNLIDDRLLNEFNSINKIYEEMRDIEWNSLNK